MAFVALLDACVLCRATLRDVLLTMAEAGIYQLRWSPDILDEVESAITSLLMRRGKMADDKAQAAARYVRETMEQAFPEACVCKEAYEKLLGTLQNHPGDRHVLAAAIAGRADVIVTFNLRHFPEEVVRPFGIEAQHPDVFMCHQFDLARERVVKGLENLARQRRHPLNSLSGILASLRDVAPGFADMVEGR